MQSIPEFQVDGKFSVTKFQEFLAGSLYTASDLINLIRTSLIVSQPRLGIALTSIALPEETNSAIQLVNQQRDISYLTLTSASDPNQKKPIVTDKEILAYYQAHPDEFKTAEQVSVEYLELSLKDIMDTIHPPEDALKNFYNENMSTYSKDNKVQPYETVKPKVIEAYTRQQAEEKFAAGRDQLADLTYEHPDSLQPAAKALELPVKVSEMFSLDKAGKDISTNKKIRDAAFSNDVLALQNNSDVIQLNSETYIVLRIKSHVPSSLIPLAAVSKQIQERIDAQNIKNQIAQVADEIYKKLQQGISEQQIADQYHVKWNALGFVGRYGNKTDVAIVDMAFQLHKAEDKNLYGIVQLPNGYSIIAVHGIRDGAIKDQKEYDVFKEQIQNSNGLLEYELYKLSVVKKAKVQMMQSI